MLSRASCHYIQVRTLRGPVYTDISAIRAYSAGPAENTDLSHETETFDAFNERYRTFFASCSDLFELQRGLNNCFAYDLVPNTAVVDAALRAARKCNDYATAVRILEGVSEKVENKGQYKAYLEELSGTIQELGELSPPPRIEHLLEKGVRSIRGDSPADTGSAYDPGKIAWTRIILYLESMRAVADRSGISSKEELYGHKL